MSSSIAVILPVYKKPENLSHYEKRIINRVRKVLIEHKLHFAVPSSLASDYKSFSNFTVIPFDDYFFHNKNTYSSLLTSILFYERFSEFKFLQIIQLDCWIFSDQLQYFASLGFDYIGAPWMEGGFHGKPKQKMWKVGNGGFSLRRTKSFLEVLNEIRYGPKGKKVVFKNRFKGIFRIIKNLGFRNNLKHYIKKAPGEDIFWSIYVPEVYDKESFRIADNRTAASYSFEVNPDFLFRDVTQGQLPMGCHNWMNNNPDFWKKYI